MKRQIISLVSLVFISCAISPPAGQVEKSPGEMRDEELTEIRRLAFEENHQELRRAANGFLSSYPDGTGSDEVRILAGSANIELNLFDDAKTVLDPLLGEQDNPYRSKACILMADVYRARGMFAEAAGMLLDVLSTDLEEPQRGRTLSMLADVAGLLSREQLELIALRHESTPGIDIILENRLAFAEAAGDTAAVRRIHEELEGAGSRAARMNDGFRSEYAVSAEFRRTAGDMDLLKIGLLCPMKGRFEPLGKAFIRGASLALKEGRLRGIDNVDVIVGNTQASPLVARDTAKRLIENEKAAALLGGVLSSSTIAVAQVAQYSGTVLLSPVASKQGIDEIGDWIFQERANSDIEIIAVARIAIWEFGLVKIAFLAVNDPGYRRTERLFRDEVERLGGEVCAAVFYDEGSTDFHGAIERIRNSHPEALLIASDVDDLVLVLPQLTYYEFGVQLLGSSAWNSKRLHRMAGRDMEGSIFPAVLAEKQIEELYLVAAANTGEPAGEVNPFVLGGYRGMRMMLQALARAGGGGERLRDELRRLMENSLQPYLEFVTGRGIPFFTVRNGRVVPYTTLRVGD